MQVCICPSVCMKHYIFPVTEVCMSTAPPQGC
uniref:Uncharacterized protein n=1 Tax=Anguilla anguilla TaxID=7936 RepID=A0A0E9PN70_ANGAN